MNIESIFLWLFGVAIFFTILYFVIYNAVKDAILSASEERSAMKAHDKLTEAVLKIQCEYCGTEYDAGAQCPNCNKQ